MGSQISMLTTVVIENLLAELICSLSIGDGQGQGHDNGEGTVGGNSTDSPQHDLMLLQESNLQRCSGVRCNEAARAIVSRSDPPAMHMCPTAWAAASFPTAVAVLLPPALKALAHITRLTVATLRGSPEVQGLSKLKRLRML